MNSRLGVSISHRAVRRGSEYREALLHEPALKNYHLLPAVRAELLARLGRNAQACEEFKRAAELAHNGRERALLLQRAAEVCKTAG